LETPVPIQELCAEWFPEARDPARLTKAVVAFYRTLDDAIADATLRSHASVACRRGCNYCCYLEVRVRAHEALVAAAWIKANLRQDAIAAITARARDNAARTEAMGRDGRRKINMRCALLGDDGSCMAYAVRPALCRKFHSTRLATCEAAHADPSRPTASPEHPAVAREAMGMIDRARNAVDAAGLDTSFYDLNRALAELLGEGAGKALRRWKAGKKIIAGPME